MNLEVALWLAGVATTLFGSGLIAYISMVQRITRVETAIQFISQKAASVLHSPHTPEMDKLLEDFLAERLTEPDAQRLSQMLTSVESDTGSAKADRLAAAYAHIGLARRFNLPIPPAIQSLMRPPTK